MRLTREEAKMISQPAKKDGVSISDAVRMAVRHVYTEHFKEGQT
jgi:hypothetical protein